MALTRMDLCELAIDLGELGMQGVKLAFHLAKLFLNLHSWADDLGSCFVNVSVWRPMAVC